MTASVRRALRLEHRLTQPNASLADLEAAVALATNHELSALTVSPWLVKPAKRKLGRSRVTLGTVIGFPHGGQILSVKAFEASKALEQGATQIDFVLNGGALASGDDETVFNDMLAVVDMAHSALAAAGVIVEADPMSEDLVRRACHLAERAGADYVVTSAIAQPSLGRPLSSGNVTVNLVPRGTLYGARVNSFDLRVAKILRFRGTRAQFGADVYNLLNTDVVTLYNNGYSAPTATRGSIWLTPTAILPARYVRLNMQLDF